MDDENEIQFAAFPIHWAGMTKNGIFVCGACPNPEACLLDRCSRASDESWEESERRQRPWR